MKIKIASLALLLTLTALTSCSSDQDRLPEQTAAVELKLGIEDLPALTRASDNLSSANSRDGGIANVDFDKYDIRYTVGAYDNEQHAVIKHFVKTEHSYAPTSINVRLNTEEKEYTFVVWADFVEKNSKEDLHYNTSDLRNITCRDAEDARLNDESRDAYTGTQKATIKEGQKNAVQIRLKRPFAKLRIVTTDWNTDNLENMPDKVKVTYYGGEKFYNYDALTKESRSKTLEALGGATDTVYTKAIPVDPATKYYQTGYDATKANRTLVVDYLMTHIKNQTQIHLKFEALKGDQVIKTKDFQINLPLQRNFLTSIVGNLLTEQQAKVEKENIQ